MKKEEIKPKNKKIPPDGDLIFGSIILGLAAGFIVYFLGRWLGFKDPSPVAIIITAIVSVIFGFYSGKESR